MVCVGAFGGFCGVGLLGGQLLLLVPRASEIKIIIKQVSDIGNKAGVSTNTFSQRMVRLRVLRWSFLCRVDGTMIMETSALTPATKALREVKKEKKQIGFDFEVALEEPWLLGGTRRRCLFFFGCVFCYHVFQNVSGLRQLENLSHAKSQIFNMIYMQHLQSRTCKNTKSYNMQK